MPGEADALVGKVTQLASVCFVCSINVSYFPTRTGNWRAMMMIIDCRLLNDAV